MLVVTSRYNLPQIVRQGAQSLNQHNRPEIQSPVLVDDLVEHLLLFSAGQHLVEYVMLPTPMIPVAIVAPKHTALRLRRCRQRRTNFDVELSILAFQRSDLRFRLRSCGIGTGGSRTENNGLVAFSLNLNLPIAIDRRDNITEQFGEPFRPMPEAKNRSFISLHCDGETRRGRVRRV